MTMNQVLSYLGGYFNSTEFELDILKIADITEFSEEEIIQQLDELKQNGNIDIINNTVTLHTIKPKKNKKFNDLYKPVETFTWKKGESLKLDI